MRQEGARAPGPRQSRTFARKRVAEVLPEILEKLIEQAKKGSYNHAKLLAEISGLLQRESVNKKVKPRRAKSLALILKGLEETSTATDTRSKL